MYWWLNTQVTFYTSYLGFNYVNTIGFILICLYIIQLLSGLQLSLYYNYSLSYYAFDSIQFIMKDVNIGNLIRIFHIIGSSFYMLFLWLHLLRGLFIKLFFYSFILSVNIYSAFLSSNFNFINQAIPAFNKGQADSQSLARIRGIVGASAGSLPSLLLYNSYLQYIINYYPSLWLSSFVNRIEVSFVNSFYFNFYYVYFIGIIIFFISIAVSFIGYTLVFGNLSYYGVIVILGIVSSVPSSLSYLIQFLFLFLSFLLIIFIIVFLFLFI
jgi:quinol-cytochrome oxidoreductase complex cytochrome b subunit